MGGGVGMEDVRRGVDIGFVWTMGGFHWVVMMIESGIL